MFYTKNSIALFFFLMISLFTSSSFGMNMDMVKACVKDVFSLKTLGFAGAALCAYSSYENLYGCVAKKISPKYYNDIDNKEKQYETEMSTKIYGLHTYQGFIEVAQELAKSLAKKLAQISAYFIVPSSLVAVCAQAGTAPKITLSELTKAIGCTFASMGTASLLAGLGKYYISKKKITDPKYAAVKFANKISYYTNLAFMMGVLPAYLVYKRLHQ